MRGVRHGLLCRATVSLALISSTCRILTAQQLTIFFITLMSNDSQQEREHQDAQAALEAFDQEAAEANLPEQKKRVQRELQSAK